VARTHAIPAGFFSPLSQHHARHPSAVHLNDASFPLVDPEAISHARNTTQRRRHMPTDGIRSRVELYVELAAEILDEHHAVDA
jgi:hypothetical protein